MSTHRSYSLSLVQGLQDAANTDATVVAIADDITIMGTVVSVEQSRDLLQKPCMSNTIQDALPAHTIIYIGRDRCFNLSGVPLSGENYILAKLQDNLDKTKEVIANICKLKNTQ